MFIIKHKETRKDFENKFYKSYFDAQYRKEVIYELDDDWIIVEAIYNQKTKRYEV